MKSMSDKPYHVLGVATMLAMSEHDVPMQRLVGLDDVPPRFGWLCLGGTNHLLQ